MVVLQQDLEAITEELRVPGSKPIAPVARVGLSLQRRPVTAQNNALLSQPSCVPLSVKPHTAAAQPHWAVRAQTVRKSESLFTQNRSKIEASFAPQHVVRLCGRLLPDAQTLLPAPRCALPRAACTWAPARSSPLLCPQQEGKQAIERLQGGFKKFDAILEAKDKQAIPRARPAAKHAPLSSQTHGVSDAVGHMPAWALRAASAAAGHLAQRLGCSRCLPAVQVLGLRMWRPSTLIMQEVLTRVCWQASSRSAWATSATWRRPW